jgi:hypothetical protein
MHQLISKHKARIIILSLIRHTQYSMTQGSQLPFLSDFTGDFQWACNCFVPSSLPDGHKQWTPASLCLGNPYTDHSTSCDTECYSLIYRCFQLRHCYTLTIVLKVYENNWIMFVLESRWHLIGIKTACLQRVNSCNRKAICGVLWHSLCLVSRTDIINTPVPAWWFTTYILSVPLEFIFIGIFIFNTGVLVSP